MLLQTIFMLSATVFFGYLEGKRKEMALLLLEMLWSFALVGCQKLARTLEQIMVEGIESYLFGVI